MKVMVHVLKEAEEELDSVYQDVSDYKKQIFLTGVFDRIAAALDLASKYNVKGA
jgi:hypothetical protein